MRVAVATDHGGFPLKGTVIDAVREAGHEPIDLGTFGPDSVDYPDYAEKAGLAPAAGRSGARGHFVRLRGGHLYRGQ